ncbi:microspherule protein 1-like [Artemia franciscana]|uniref:FHA domain-containing protein n=2 Tax=Artemia franciscana TaxID=6661 RepID=A0AA88IAN9_ARTSF|nr:hypothetical protein QYM36_001449 [Artemia franciscana]KAK2725000.1 hypothetical protein QYM36_001449 [Artemia franciscana]KAK2725001.1 hypothetical protein QYM36_001449 [Artemia franciscana]
MEDTAAEIVQKRSSGRPIKRKKFNDDEIGTNRINTKSAKQRHSIGKGSKDSFNALIQQTKKQTSRVCKRPRKANSKQGHIAATRDLGRWKPADDLALITGVLQTNDLVSVHRGVKFSCHFTLDEVTDRWYALMYDKLVSKTATAGMRNLHPETVASIQARTLYSKEEEDALADIESTTKAVVQTFEDLIREKPTVFHVCRTGKALLAHWQLMKQYNLLKDQDIQPIPKGDNIMQFHDAESLLRDSELGEPTNDFLENELVASDRMSKRSIRRLESEVKSLQNVAESLLGTEFQEFDSQTLSMLKGKVINYHVKSKEVTIGRSTPNSAVDIDLSREGPAWKISRRQGVIRLTSLGKFILVNEGKRPMYVDGKVLLSGAKTKLVHNSVIEVAGLSFVFVVNQDLLTSLRTEAKQQSNVPSSSSQPSASTSATL